MTTAIRMNRNGECLGDVEVDKQIALQLSLLSISNLIKPLPWLAYSHTNSRTTSRTRCPLAFLHFGQLPGLLGISTFCFDRVKL